MLPQASKNTGLWLVNTGHVTWILASHWLIEHDDSYFTYIQYQNIQNEFA